MIKVGIPVIVDNNSWVGGLNYFISLISAVSKMDNDIFDFYVLTNAPEKFLAFQSKGVHVVHCPLLSSKNKLLKLLNFVLNSNLLLELYAKLHSIDIISHYHSSFLFRRKTLFWMPDFQHKHLPSLFSKKEKIQRDRKVVSAAKSGSILFSSASSRSDFERFYPAISSCEKHVLQFVPKVDFDNDSVETSDAIKKLSTPNSHVFFLPNQFWQHKNHDVVVEALKRLPENYVVLCSGAMTDYRSSAHISNLLEKVRLYGLEQRFIFLGLLERSDMCMLMKQSKAVINPSFFEGWSTTVEESKAYGKRVILSDITVHREQNPTDALYFNPDSPVSLEKCMRTIVDEFDYDKEHNRSRCAHLNYDSNVLLFANSYMDILNVFIKNSEH